MGEEKSDNFIPMFKKSGDGIAKDVLKLKKLEAISDGWYKGQLISLLEKVAGKILVNGVLCYNTDIVLNGYTNISDTSEHAKNIRKLMKLFGLSDSALANIYNTWSNNTIDYILLNFNKVIESNKVYTLGDFKKAIKELRNNLSDVSYMELTNSDKLYDYEETNRPAIGTSQIHIGDVWIIDKDYFGELQKYQTTYSEEGAIEVQIPIQRTYGLDQSMHFSELKLFNSNSEDITNNFTEMYLLALKAMLITSGNLLFSRTSIVKVSEALLYDLDNMPYKYNVTSRERFSTDFILTIYDTEYERYKLKSNLLVQDYVGDEYITNGIYANHLWEYFALYEYYDNDTRNNLFYVEKSRRNILTAETTKRYITVEGLKNSTAESIARQIATYADFQFVVPRKKKKFLGIGGFIGSFLGGIFEGILSIVSKIAGLLYYIPIVRLGVQFVGWVFSGKWSNDKERFKQVATRVFLAVVAVLIVIATGGGGVQIAISLITSGITMATGLKKYDDLVEYSQKQNERNQNVVEEKLLEKALDLSNDENIANKQKELMYKPFDAINEMYKSPFDKGGIYTPSFGLKT